MLNRIKILATSWALISIGSVYAEPVSIGENDRVALSIAIYNADLAMINDQRAISIVQGEGRYDFLAVSPRINHASAILHPIPEGVFVMDQQFKTLTTPADLLHQSVGQMVTLVSTHPASGEITRSAAKILAVENGLVMEIDGNIETDLAGRRIVYDSLPGAVFSPSLSVGLSSEQAQDIDIVLSYLSQGLSWTADYIARMNEAEDAMSLRAMATLENHSGVDFKAAQIQLIAGAVNQAQADNNHFEARAMAAPMAMKMPGIASVALSDLHRYALPGQFDLLNKNTIQIMMFEARDVPVSIQYSLSGQAQMYYAPNMAEQKYTIDRFIEFDNKTEANLGLPMPAGTVRVYQGQADGQAAGLYFIGEDRISHTPENAQIRLKTGQAFDLEAVRHQRAYRRLPVQQPYRSHSEVDVETIISNGKDQAVFVHIDENFSGEWSLIKGPKPDETHARSASWVLEVPAKQKASLKLTVRVKS